MRNTSKRPASKKRDHLKRGETHRQYGLYRIPDQDLLAKDSARPAKSRREFPGSDRRRFCCRGPAAGGNPREDKHEPSSHAGILLYVPHKLK
ncbi:hypothetical protein BFN67_10750 [Pseudaminobacter manganicus]|uniref:Uncharacterized protein n=1 Tax=Manganibacter manganicus TaxID=1873176 RepID=A0A1V8RW46_9HYPH|nr:hypothetical protein BFN67_10750 [Pseudaminobacter manganicus]